MVELCGLCGASGVPHCYCDFSSRCGKCKTNREYCECKKPMRLYLAGPMRGHEFFNATAFFTAAGELRKKGYHVYNPHELDSLTGFNCLTNTIDDLNLKSTIRIDIEFILEHSDALCMLPGWEESKGARAEKAVAEWAGIEVFSYPGLEVI